MRFIYFSLAYLTLLSCDTNKAKLLSESTLAVETPEESPAPEKKKDSEDQNATVVKNVAKKEDVSTKETGVQFQQSYVGAHTVYLNSKALTQVFKRVSADFSRSDFSAVEKVKLQDFCYHTDDDCELNMRHPTRPSLDYFKVLRAGAARACKTLVEKDMSSLSSENILVKSEGEPTQKGISDFMGRVFGYVGSEQEVPGADKLVSAYKEFLGKTQDKEQGRKDAYLLLCVSVATDVRSFTR